MLGVILDIKCYIATFNETAWFLMYRYDPEFRKYAITSEGIKKFRVIFNQSRYTIKSNTTSGRLGWYLLNIRHRENNENNIEQPAIICDNGTMKYYRYGELHRDGDAPAIINANGSVEYYKNNIRHRDNDKNGKSQPAYRTFNDSTVIYYYNGVLHREGDNPSWSASNNTIQYYKNGELHRDDDANGNPQPAVIYVWGAREYFKNGIKFEI